MLLALSGVTGIGKSYFKDKLVEKLDFEKIKIITTREMRIGEKNNEDKVFVTSKELQVLKEHGEIAYEFDMLGNIYAYSKKELFSKKNTVFELHYKTIYDFKKICPHLCVIYLLPSNLEIAKEKTRQRHLPPDIEAQRILEIDEHYHEIMTNANLRNMFDYFIYNNYDKESENNVIQLVNKIMMEKV